MTVGGARRPAHTMYGGAHLFRADLAARIGVRASEALERHAPDAAAFGSVFGHAAIATELRARVAAKLARDAVEDYRVDFEDGYGVRTDAEEDAHAEAVGRALAEGAATNALPSRVGVRVKADPVRARRTLDALLEGLAGPRLPAGFVVAFPKVRGVEDAAQAAALLDDVEDTREWPRGTLRLELMVEEPTLLRVLRAAVDATDGRCVALHFGAYDYTAALGIAAPHQTLDHPACDHARQAMQLAMAGTHAGEVALVDGATTAMPVGETAQVHAAWRLHAANVRRALVHGFWQGWDLHPAQLVARWTAVFAFFLEAAPAMRERLRAFEANEERATRVGAAFDDAATGRGLRLFFERGVACGALDPEAGSPAR